MKRYKGFLIGIMLASIAFLAMGQRYITDVGKDWRIKGAVLEDCQLTGSTMNPGRGETYYVDHLNGDDTYDGLSWATAVETVTKAIALSNARMAVTANVWDRNTIYIGGTGYTEDVVLMAKYTDIVGVGAMQPYINGTWVIPNAAANAGCHFYNLTFIDDGAGGAIFDITGQAGVEWHNCRIAYQTTDDYGIVLENCRPFLIKDCMVGAYGTGPGDLGYSIAAIKIADGSNTIYGSMIENCTITSLGIGIDWDEDATSNCWITGNLIYAQGLTIDEEGDKVRVVNNRMITEIDTGTQPAGYDFSLTLAAGNILTGSTCTDNIPWALDSQP